MIYIRVLVIGLILFLPSQGEAKVYIDINAPSIRKLPIAIPELKDLGSPGPSEDVGKGLYDTLIQDLEIAGLFEILDRKGYIEDSKGSGIQLGEIDFSSWRVIGAEALIKGGFTLKWDDLAVEIRLFDVFQEKVLIGKSYSGKKADLRRVIHRFANEVIEALTGEKGIFETRLLLVLDTGGSKEVYIADYDGYNPRQVTRNGSINLSPQWSPDGSRILYTS
ncbi:MAG: PD40 domain-containing protein, partial [Deltaproteobacteria bacterium]|nr:PD40 domain-containing protein [Deltaproteobacteria bacterium]